MGGVTGIETVVTAIGLAGASAAAGARSNGSRTLAVTSLTTDATWPIGALIASDICWNRRYPPTDAAEMKPSATTKEVTATSLCMKACLPSCFFSCSARSSR